MALTWEDTQNGLEASDCVCLYRMDDPDSLGKYEVKVKLLKDDDVAKNWRFVCYEFGLEETKKRVSQYSQWVLNINQKS